MLIRKATKKDIDVLAHNNLLLAKESERKDLSLDTVSLGVKAVLTDPSKGFYLLAEEEGIVVGQLMITFEWSDWRNSPIWWMQSVYVVPTHRRKGIFSQMYRHVLSLAKKQGAVEVRLYVHTHNTLAMMTYEQCGLQQSSYHIYHRCLS